MKKIQLIIGCVLILIFDLISFPQTSWTKEIKFVPGIELKGVYDDNLDFESKDEKDSFGTNVIPNFRLRYASELLELSLFGDVDILKYFTETDFDRTNHHYGIKGVYIMSPRWNFTNNFSYRRDETIDSQLEETGQSDGRKRVQTYDGGAGLFYKFSELSDIGLSGDYRRRDYSSRGSNDYQRYTAGLPYTKRFANQRDILALIPEYSIFDSDNAEDAKDYRFTVQWDRLISETLTSQIHAGGRYTDIDQESGDNDTNWGYLGKLGLIKTGETFSGAITATRDIRANSDGEIVEVHRLLLKADKLLSERTGFRFKGSIYYTETESDESEDDKTRYFELIPQLYYLITENHSIELEYQYQHETELDEPGDPVTQRNKVWLGLVLQFPQKY
jgi:hypothetical protein